MAKKNNNPQTPILSSMSMKIKAEVNSQTIPPVEKTKDRKEKLLNILDAAAKNFEDNLLNGVAKVTTVSDLEKIAKLTLTLSGETTDIKGGQTVETTEIKSNIPEGTIQLDTEDESVKAVFNMLYGQMNENNDK